jgi:hypothetical protein
MLRRGAPAVCGAGVAGCSTALAKAALFAAAGDGCALRSRAQSAACHALTALVLAQDGAQRLLSCAAAAATATLLAARCDCACAECDAAQSAACQLLAAACGGHGAAAEQQRMFHMQVLPLLLACATQLRTPALQHEATRVLALLLAMQLASQ